MTPERFFLAFLLGLVVVLVFGRVERHLASHGEIALVSDVGLMLAGSSVLVMSVSAKRKRARAILQ